MELSSVVMVEYSCVGGVELSRVVMVQYSIVLLVESSCDNNYSIV